MNENHQKLTQARLKELLEYNLHTGDFIWLKNVGSRARAGAVAGHLNRMGYVDIYIDRKPYQAHRLAFLYIIGRWPENDVDHINQVRNDNSWINLRPATRSQNQHNRKLQKDNKSGTKNVHWVKAKQRWEVRVMVNGVTQASLHTCLLNAVATAHRLRRELHGTFANHG